MKKLTILFFICAAALYGQAQDSIDIRAILQKQIDAARERDRIEQLKMEGAAQSEEKVYYGPELPPLERGVVFYGPEPLYYGPELPQEPVKETAALLTDAAEKKEAVQKIVSAPVMKKNNAPQSENWKFYVLGGAALLAFSFVMVRRMLQGRSKKTGKNLKNNIRILREENVVKREQPELKSVRSKLLNSPVILNNHGKPLAEVAKELNIAQGEIILAAKIKSYELAKGEKSKWYLN